MNTHIKSKYNIVDSIYDFETIEKMRSDPQNYAEGTYPRFHNAQYENNSMIEYYHIRNNNGKKVFNYGKHPEFGKNPYRMPSLIKSQESQWGGKKNKIQTRNRRITRHKSRKQKKHNK